MSGVGVPQPADNSATKESRPTLIMNAQDRVADAEQDLESARRRLESRRRELADLLGSSVSS